MNIGSLSLRHLIDFLISYYMCINCIMKTFVSVQLSYQHKVTGTRLKAATLHVHHKAEGGYLTHTCACFDCNLIWKGREPFVHVNAVKWSLQSSSVLFPAYLFFWRFLSSADNTSRFSIEGIKDAYMCLSSKSYVFRMFTRVD